MINITILLRHPGSWVYEIEYENYRIDEILLRDNVDGISKQLGMIVLETNGIRYTMEGNRTPMKFETRWA
uniref:Putative ovule protein n=1 Tax=Solanum chacoense TaxID=4108 RepID=A0A0V0GV23_SOLCH